MSEVTNAKYAKVIARIQSGTMSRAELSKLKRNAEEKLKQGDAAAQQVLDAMDVAVPDDAYILFMGFARLQTLMVASILNGKKKASAALIGLTAPISRNALRVSAKVI